MNPLTATRPGPSLAPSERVHVAQVITRFTAGAGGVALRGALALDPDRWRVTVLTAAGGSLIERAEEAGLEVVSLRSMSPELRPREDAAGLRELIGHLRTGRYHVVHTHSAKAGGLGRLAARRVGVPAVIHTFHGFPFHDFQSPLRRRAYLAMERRLGRITDRFLAVGASVAAEAVRLGIASPERIRTISSAIDGSFRPAAEGARAAARLRMGLPADARVIGTVGRLDHQKAPLDLVAAVAELGRSDTHLVWVGDGPLRGATLADAGRRGLRDRVHLLGERDDVADLLPGFDVFAMSSLYEGLPCALVEAMTTGVPAVATAVNSVPEIVLPGRTGLLVPPARPRLLAAALRHLLDHPSEAAAMAAEARRLLGDRFDPARLGEDLERTYSLALDDRPEPSPPAGRARR